MCPQICLAAAAVGAAVKCGAAYTFDSVAAAGKWVHDNPGKAAVGTVIVVGGTVLIVGSGGTLAPCAALAL